MTEAMIAALYLITIGLTLYVLSLLDRLAIARRNLAAMTDERDYYKAATGDVAKLRVALSEARRYPTHPVISREHPNESNT
jgi:hypothetical protein